ncbi:MAG: DNA internalization-related competence protein ComEC/Rec2 [Methylibium sp.]|nr:DNA internalization-related competence protein ComEC/Rec2 [Methylibium sp.]
MPPGARLIATGLALVAGSALQLQQPALWAPVGYATALLLALLLLGSGRLLRPRGATAPWLLGVLAIAVLAFAATGLRAGLRLGDALAAELEGRDVTVIGTVASLPRRAPEAWRFVFEVESAQLDERAVVLPARVALGWYARGAEQLPELRAGQRWQVVLRLKRPHGLANPHGFDYELYLFERGVRATGYVRTVKGARNELLTERAGHAVDRVRQGVRDAIGQRVSDPATAGVLAALAIGDQAAIEREDWALYRDTGVAHLMSISGLHVTMFAWVAGLAGTWLWRRSRRAMLRCPAPSAGRWIGLGAALAYAVLAGWGVPAQRTVLMLATTTLIGAAGLRWSWPLVWTSAAAVVSLIDPWALLQPGFWLSFVAVGLLLASGEARGLVRTSSGLEPAGVMASTAQSYAARPSGHEAQAPTLRASRDRFAAVRLRAPRWSGIGRQLGRVMAGGVRTQAVATLGLAPLSLVFFQQLSVVGFAANLAAIPLVTLLVTPLALLGVLLPALWPLAGALVDALDALLRVLAASDGAVWSVAAAAPWAVACGLLGGALGLLPLPWRVRLLALPLVLPLLAPHVARPGERAFELTAIDVGQGTAVLVRTARHSLLFDTGPRYSIESDAGERVLLPLLRSFGERRLDLLMLSHRDTDHVGGAAALLRALPVTALTSSLEAGHPLLALAGEHGTSVRRCEAGQRWAWDGVSFEVLHPDGPMLDAAVSRKTKPNSLSCVLRIGGHWGGAARSVLLSGDIERADEAQLVARDAGRLSSEVLLVPHHGSKTSSSALFLDAVSPRLAVVQAGYRNRFDHPAADVLARFEARGIAVLASARCGAWTYGPQGESCRRDAVRRYWHHPDASALPVGPGEGVAGAAAALPYAE